MARTYSLNVMMAADDDPARVADMIQKQLSAMDADFFHATITFDDFEQEVEIEMSVICGKKDLSPACVDAPGHDGPCTFEALRAEPPQ